MSLGLFYVTDGHLNINMSAIKARQDDVDNCRRGGDKAMKRTMIISAITAFFLAFTLPIEVMAAAPDAPDSASAPATEEILVRFQPGVNASDVAQIHRQLRGQAKGDISALSVQVVAVPRGEAAMKVKEYSSHPEVAYAEPNYIAKAVGSPDDPYFAQQWGLTKIEAPQAWGITTGNANISIAILDTGVDPNHPDLTGKIVGSVNFTGSATVNDIYGHGTHVAGIAAARTNNGAGVAGLGYDSTIMNVKVLGDDGYGSYSGIAQGIIWAADNGAKVINMSLGGASASTTLENAINYAWSKGVVVVAAAGNNGNSLPFYPAYYTNVIAVAATDNNDNLPTWSNFGDWVDVAAPGASIYSTLINAGYGYKSGTSMASPHTAGLAALIYTVMTDSNGDGRLNDEVRLRLETTADRLSTTGTGNGRINAYKAVSNLAQLPQPEPLPVQTMKISNIAMSIRTSGAGSRKLVWAVANVNVVDGSNNPVSGATVSGHWTGATNDTDTKTTNTNGQAVIQSNQIKNPRSTITFTFVVDSVSKAGWVWSDSPGSKTASISYP
jgi:thermitase